MTSSLALVASSPAAAASPPARELLARVHDLRQDLERPDLQLAAAVSVSRQADILTAAARAAHLGLDVANEASEVKLRAERRCGGLLRQLTTDAGPSSVRVKPGEPPRARQSLPAGTLQELGISSKESSAWQLVSRLSDAEFEQRVQAVKSARRQLHSGLFVRAARQYARPVSGRPTTPTASVLRRALLLLKNVSSIRTSTEQELARGIVLLVEEWDVELPVSGPREPTSWTRETTCLLCARPQPLSKPARCACGGNWVGG